MKYISGNLSEEDYTNLLKTFDPTEEDVLDKKLPHVGLKGGSKFFGNYIFGFKFQTSSPNTQIQIIPQGMEVKKVLIDGEKVEPENNSYTFSNEGTHVVKIFSSDIWTSIEGTFINGWTNLKEIEFPSSIEDFDSDSIVGCSGLEKLKFGKKIQEINGDLSTLGLREIEISERNKNLRLIDRKYIVSYEHPDTLLGTLDGTIPTNPQIKKLSKGIYTGKTLTDFVIPGNIEEIGDGSFEGCTFTGSLKLGEGIKKINSKAFYNIDISELDTLIIKPITPPTIVDLEYFDLRDLDGNGDPISGVEFELVGNLGKYITNSRWKSKLSELSNIEYQYLTFTALESGSFSLRLEKITVTNFFGNHPSEISYSIDNGNTWTTVKNITDSSNGVIITTPTIVQGNSVIWKGIAETFGTYDPGPGLICCSKFESTGKYDISGNILSIFYGEDFIGKDRFPVNSYYRACCARLFSGAQIVSAKRLILPIKLDAYNIYSEMFKNNYYLIEVPELSSTELEAGCYKGMFEGCTSLTEAPELPATELTSSCYNSMFKGCTSLTTAPELPATTLAASSYHQMFYGCSNLNYIKALFTTTPGGPTIDWVNGVAAAGTFIKNSLATWNVTGNNGIPSGWTVETASS